jgi:4-amino-4-deoxychorismate lyase
MKNLYQKSMSLLVESIQLQNGKLLNIRFHNERMFRSLSEVFGLNTNIGLEKLVTIPEMARKGVFKCRVEYDTEIRKIEFIPYTIRVIKSLKIVEDNTIEYGWKFADRKRLSELFSMREKADDILIIKNGMVTDTSSANVVFRDSYGNWVTPSTFLLPGTRRASLLYDGIIKEAIISYRDICKYTEVKLINAMIGLDDTEGIPITNLL